MTRSICKTGRSGQKQTGQLASFVPPSPAFIGVSRQSCLFLHISLELLELQAKQWGTKNSRGFSADARLLHTVLSKEVRSTIELSLPCRSGGVQGGLSNGEDIVIKVAFKPTSTIAKKQSTVSRDGQDVDLLARGRHDPCVVPRAVPMVEAMVALVLADQLLQVVLVLFPIMLVLLPPPNTFLTASDVDRSPGRTTLLSNRVD